MQWGQTQLLNLHVTKQGRPWGHWDTQATASSPVSVPESPWFVLFSDPSELSSHGPETGDPGGCPVGTAAAPGPPHHWWDPVLKAPRIPGSVRSPADSHNLTLALRPSEGNGGPETGPSPAPHAQGVAFSEAKESAFMMSPSSLVQLCSRAIDMFTYIIISCREYTQVLLIDLVGNTP